MTEATPFFMSFAQFLAAPRAGRLGDALRRLPSRPLTPDEVMAANEMEEARAAMGINGDAAEARCRYEQAHRAWTVLRSTMKEATERWLYDRAVETGIIIPTQIEPDPAGELEKLEKKDQREREKRQAAVTESHTMKTLYYAELRDEKHNQEYQAKISGDGQELWADIAWVVRGLAKPGAWEAEAAAGDFDGLMQRLKREITRRGYKIIKEKHVDVDKSDADRLLPDVTESDAAPTLTAEPVDDLVVEDAALDYAENALGRFYFAQHWSKHRDAARVEAWLREHGYSVPTDRVMGVLDQLAESGLWRQ